MPSQDFARPSEGFRFNFGGMKTNARPDALPVGKYPVAVNVREYESGTLQARPGISPLFQAGGGHGIFTDIRALIQLSTTINNPPRIFGRNADDTIWLDTGVQVGSLAGGGASLGAVMLPFRPAESPTPWMYIANGSDYQKFSSPTALNAVTQNKVGIAEPQVSIDAVPQGPTFQQFLPSGAWAAGGTVGGLATGNRSTDTIVTAIQDPASALLVGYSSRRWSLQVAPTVQYQIGEIVTFFTNGGHSVTSTVPIEDVIPPLGGTLSIQSIFYFVGSTGRCVIVLGGTGATHKQSGERALNVPVPGGPIGEPPGRGGPPASIPRPPAQVSGGPQGNALQQAASSLRRGALLILNPGGGNQETVFVNSVATGPNQTVCIEVVTSNSHSAGETINSVPAIIVNNQLNGAVPQFTITGDSNTESFNATVGIGTITATMNAAIAALPLDYWHLSVNIDVPQSVVEIRILLDVGDGSFTQNYYYYSVAPSDIVAATTNATTQSSQLAAIQELLQRDAILDESAAAGLNVSTQGVAGSSQWTEMWFPINGFTRVGGDQTKTIYNATKMQIQVNTLATVNVKVSSITAQGGFSPDVGDIGEPYHYRIRPRASGTGVKGNPSPDMRYGCASRRQQNNLIVPTSYSDSQVDTWDIFRFGGSVPQWRFISSIPIGSAVFVDNVDDAAASIGEALDFDNFEPWPSVQIPFAVTETTGFVTGTIVSINSPPFSPANFLPGNLIVIQAPGNAGSVVLTLRERPTNPSGSQWIFETVECGGTVITGLTTTFLIQEPEIANQHLPFMWGPDVNGTFFACGDPLRPGTLYFSKNYAPDAAPDTYNVEITAPTEPLLGGEIIDGVSYVASPTGWWRLYFQPDNPAQRYSFVKEPIDRGLAAPFGHCNDGKNIFFWAEDSIRSNQGSLTDADLYNLFPHDGAGFVGTGGDYVYNGVTIPAPDYSRANAFRLSYGNGYLYATYQAHSTGSNFNCLTLNTRTGAWCLDSYNNTLGPSVIYHLEQPKGTEPVTGQFIAATVNGGLAQGAVFQSLLFTNDNGSMVNCVVAVREFDGGDIRSPKQWGDYFFDSLPIALGGPKGITVQPMSLGTPVGTPTISGPSSSRVRLACSVGPNLVISDFMGLFIFWDENFTGGQQAYTQIYAWQPSYDIQPARSIEWQTFGSSLGLQGYGHLRQIAFAWVSTAPITISMVTVDGADPQNVILPSSGGVYTKQMFPLTFNKGQLFTWHAVSTAPFQIFEDDCEIFVGQWGRSGPYAILKTFGGVKDASSPV